MANRFAKPRRGAQVEVALPAQFYRQLADLSPQILWSARPDGSAEFFNARACQYSGRTAQQLEGWGWRSIVHPEDWQRCMPRWTKAFKRGQPYEVEYRLRRHDGRYFWHLGSAMPHREGGRIVRWFGSCTEIENQKRAERLLAKARGALATLVDARAEHDASIDSRFRSLVDSAPILVWESGPDKLCTYFSKSWLQFTGRGMEQELGNGWAEGVHPDDLERCLAIYGDAFDSRRPFEMEYRLRRHDGQYRWIFDRGAPAFDAKNVFLGYIGSCIDITDRHGEQARLRAFLDSMPAIAWIKDSRLRYQWVSASYERVHGKSLQQVCGRDDFEVWTPELARVFQNDDELALRVNGPVQSVNAAPYADGSEARWLVVKFPLPDESGEFGVAGIGFDMTEHAPAESGDAQSEPLRRLSGRERQVLRLWVEGRTSAETGTQLGLSPKSVDTYRSRLMAKLDIHGLPALVKFALRHGLTGDR